MTYYLSTYVDLYMCIMVNLQTSIGLCSYDCVLCGVLLCYAGVWCMVYGLLLSVICCVVARSWPLDPTS